MPEYGLDPIELPDGSVIDTTDLVRRREVDEWDAGWIPNLEWRHGDGRGSLQAGAAFRLHSGRHWGFVQWAQYYPSGLDPDHRYYDYRLDKQTMQPFVQESWRFNDEWNLMAGLTWTIHRYEMKDDKLKGVEVDESFSYLLPRLGVTYPPHRQLSFFANVSRGGREPAFRDIYDPQSYWSPAPLDLDPEELTDYELGGTYAWTTGRASLNLYYLDFDNAIVWAGGLDNNGDPVTANGAVTEHRGVEIDLEWQPSPRVRRSSRSRLVEKPDRRLHRARLRRQRHRPLRERAAGESGVAGLSRSPRHRRPGNRGAHLCAMSLISTSTTPRTCESSPRFENDPDYIHRVNEAYTALDLGSGGRSRTNRGERPHGATGQGQLPDQQPHRRPLHHLRLFRWLPAGVDPGGNEECVRGAGV